MLSDTEVKEREVLYFIRLKMARAISIWYCYFLYNQERKKYVCRRWWPNINPVPTEMLEYETKWVL